MSSYHMILASTPPTFKPSDISGLVGWYDYASYNNGTGSWADKSGNGNHATASVSVSQVSVSGNGSSKTIYALRCDYNGGNCGKITWPSNILPSTYTLLYVARYTGVSNNRIMNGIGLNWLSGWWNNGIKNFFHNGWISNTGGYGTDNNWHYVTDQNSLGRFDGVTIGTTGSGSPNYCQIGINDSGYESSECDVVEVLVYNSNISSTDYGKAETYLKNRYGL